MVTAFPHAVIIQDGVCLDGECVECVIDGDCNLNGGCSSCEANSCVAPECCSDDDCEVRFLPICN